MLLYRAQMSGPQDLYNALVKSVISLWQIFIREQCKNLPFGPYISMRNGSVISQAASAIRLLYALDLSLVGDGDISN